MGFGTIKLDRLLSFAQAAERLSIKEGSLRQLQNQRRLPVVRVGRKVALLESFVDNAVRNGIVWDPPGTYATKDPREANRIAQEHSRKLIEADQQEVCSGKAL